MTAEGESLQIAAQGSGRFGGQATRAPAVDADQQQRIARHHPRHCRGKPDRVTRARECPLCPGRCPESMCRFSRVAAQ